MTHHKPLKQSMSKPAKSIYAFSLYAGTGIFYLAIPNVMLGLFSVPPTNEVWIRVVGMLMVWMALVQNAIARHEVRPLFIWTVITRIGSFFFLTAFVVLGWVPVVLLPFASIDLIGALWTWYEMRQQERKPQSMGANRG